jgi:hypothetical protein
MVSLGLLLRHTHVGIHNQVVKQTNGGMRFVYE